MQDERKPRVIVAHPSKQHSFYTATAFEHAGMLEAYITTVYDKEGSITHGLKRLLRGKDLKKASTRSCPEIPNEKVVQFYELDYLVSLFLNRIPKLRRFRERHRRYVANKFGKKVAKYAMEHQVDAVIMYDSTAEKCFEYIKKHSTNIICILDVSIADRKYLRTIFENDLQPEYEDDFKNEQWIVWDDKMISNLQHENALTDYFLVPSNFVRNSLMCSGVRNEQVKIVPYGVDTKLFNPKSVFEHSKPLRLIYVGACNYRKGLHHLLNVVSEFSERDLCLDICGGYDNNSSIYLKYRKCKNINFCGFITRDILTEKYQNADAFVIATLGEGLAQVCEEALACGLPTICTECSGINDWIENGRNGFVVKAGDEEQLKKCLIWCVEHKDELHNMSAYSRVTAEELSLENYYMRLINTFEELQKTFTIN